MQSAEKLGKLVFRQKLPRAKSRLHESKAKAEKQRQAELDAEAKYRQMDRTELLSMVVLEIQLGMNNKKTGRITAKKHGALDWLCHGHPELAKSFDLHFQSGGRQTPRGRSTSKGSKSSRRSSSKPQPSSKPQSRTSS